MKNNMRIQLVPNLKLEQKQKYNSTQEKYLKILSSSYEELHQYILDKASTNPLIEYNSSLDPDLLLEFDDYSKPQLRDVLFEHDTFHSLFVRVSYFFFVKHLEVSQLLFFASLKNHHQ